MFRFLKSQARRSARRARYAVLTALSAAVGAGFLSTALYAALLQAGQPHAIAALILGSLWFGLSGVFLLLKGGVGADEGAHSGSDVSGVQAAAPHVAHPHGHVSTAPSVAEAFVSGMNEGAGFARMQQGRS